MCDGVEECGVAKAEVSGTRMSWPGAMEDSSSKNCSLKWQHSELVYVFNVSSMIAWFVLARPVGRGPLGLENRALRKKVRLHSLTGSSLAVTPWPLPGLHPGPSLAVTPWPRTSLQHCKHLRVVNVYEVVAFVTSLPHQMAGSCEYK